jgi:hypothetical protein
LQQATSLLCHNIRPAKPDACARLLAHILLDIVRTICANLQIRDTAMPSQSTGHRQSCLSGFEHTTTSNLYLQVASGENAFSSQIVRFCHVSLTYCKNTKKGNTPNKKGRFLAV